MIKIKFNIISDIHLEFFKKKESIDQLLKKISELQNSNIICLLGDIGYPKHELYKYFLGEVLKLYKYVLLISGNHELYNSSTTYDKMHEKINQICNELNANINSPHRIIYLQKSSIEIDGYIFIGCTLWSQIINHQIIKDSMNDYQKIKKYIYRNNLKRKIPISTFDVNIWHSDHLNWIQEQLKLYGENNKKIIVLTHHAPITDNEIHPSGCRSICSEAYCTDLNYLLSDPIIAWCYGHTHQEYSKKKKGILIQSNPMDYYLMKLDKMENYFTVELTD